MPLLQRIKKFCESNGISERKFGELCTNDHSLVRDMRKGRMLSESKKERIEQFLRVKGGGNG